MPHEFDVSLYLVTSLANLEPSLGDFVLDSKLSLGPQRQVFSFADRIGFTWLLKVSESHQRTTLSCPEKL